MNLTLDIDTADNIAVPVTETQMTHWITTALTGAQDIPHAMGKGQPDYEIALRITHAEESATLNEQYRGKAKPTNILSFPAELPADIPIPLLGDLVVCADIVNQEAREHGKAEAAHWAHILIHGTLHLLGYDHQTDKDAEIMETLETELVIGLGFPPPYEESNSHLLAGAPQTQ